MKVPVRTLAEYVYRSGSIQSGFKTSSSFTEGARIHREIQKNYHESDRSEVFLKSSIEYEDILYLIEGRCDGLLHSGERITIDEIKSTSLSLELIDEDSYPVHWAQADCYAYMYLQQTDIELIDIQLTYVQKSTNEIRRFKRTRSRGELDRIVLHLIKMYAPFARLRMNHVKYRNPSINQLSFPFDAYRKGQRLLAGAVYKTIVDQQVLFASAPTGIGKTISTIFPAVKAIGEGEIQSFFYLTAKTTTRQSAEEAFRLLEKQGLLLKVVSITAKDKICMTEEGICSKEYCPYADGYYDRINEAVLDILRNEQHLDRECISKYARKHKVCPFEYSLELAYGADAVISDYNYVFDPTVSLKRLFEDQKKRTVLLVDEAHNLVDRGREMFSAELEKADFLKLRREYKDKDRRLSDVCKNINEYFIQIKKRISPVKAAVFDEDADRLNELIAEFIDYAERKLVQADEFPEHLLDTYFACQGWIRISKQFDEHYALYAGLDGNDVKVKQFCLDPSHFIRQAAKQFKAVILFSATLSPFKYYNDMLGGDEHDYRISIDSPFTSEQVVVLIKSLSTRFHDREKSIRTITDTIEKAVKSTPGNYLVFFPSYKYLNSVADEWAARNTGIDTIIQGPGMREGDREGYLNSFQDENTNSLIGFAVLGGIFSEGVDLKGDRLNGVIVVGVGLPQIGFERDLIKTYFSKVGKNGYDYAYIYPGMNKVLQAGGRLIRSETDTGTIILVDDRYLHAKYQQMLPVEWRNFRVI